MTPLGNSPTLGLLAESVSRRRVRLGIAIGLALVSAASGVATPLLVAHLITALAEHSSLVAPVAWLAGCAVVGAFAGGWSAYLLSAVGERAVADVRIAVVRRTVRLPLAAIRRVGTGNLVARLGGDAAQLRSLTDTAVTALPVSAVMVTAYLIVMGLLDWVLLLVTAGTFAVAAVAIRAFLAGMRRGTQAQQQALGELAQSAQSVFEMASTIKAYGAEQSAVRAIEIRATDAADAATRTARSQAGISPLMGLGQQVAIVGVLAFGGARLESGALSVAHFMAFLTYLFQLVNPLMTLAQGAGRLQVGRAASTRLDEVLSTEAEPLGAGAAPELLDPEAALRLHEVSVSLSGKPTLDRLSLTVPRTGITAVVGPSGAGKSTLLNTIERFVEPTSGTISMFGIPLRRWPLAAARRRLALVEQGGAILDASVRDNLCLGLTEPVSDAHVHDVLSAVGLDDVVRGLPDGLDTRLGLGLRLSGGEIQRLSVARALLTEAAILLLDEPSSHLDGTNEARLAAVLREIARDRAVVVVAHRPRLVAEAHTIVVMDAGRVVASGDHRTLLATCPLYRRLSHAQFDDDQPSSTSAVMTGAPAAVLADRRAPSRSDTPTRVW